MFWCFRLQEYRPRWFDFCRGLWPYLSMTDTAYFYARRAERRPNGNGKKPTQSMSLEFWTNKKAAELQLSGFDMVEI